MTEKSFLSKKLFVKAIFALFPLHISAAPLIVEYASPIGDENWHMTGSRLRCGLALTVPNFGIAYFEQYATKQPHFIMTKWQQVGKRLPATVFAGPPMWKPQDPIFFISKTTISPGKYGVYLSHEPALKSLTYLAQGYQTKILYQAEEGFKVSVALSPVRFQEAYAEYQECLGNLLSFTYEQVAVSILLFNTDNYELNDEDKVQLDKIAEYFRADASIKKIWIAGYTDDSGRKSYNNAISEDRAKAVSKYLLTRGIKKNEMSITWYGALNPAQPNDTDAGKAANRRVVVKLIK